MNSVSIFIVMAINIYLSYKLTNYILNKSKKKWNSYFSALEKFAKLLYKQLDVLKEKCDSAHKEVEEFLKDTENVKYLPMITAENFLVDELENIQVNRPVLFFGSPVKKFYSRYGKFVEYIRAFESNNIQVDKVGSNISIRVLSR